MLIVVTYKQYQCDENGYMEHTVTFDNKWLVRKELEKWEKEGNPIIITGMWCC